MDRHDQYVHKLLNEIETGHAVSQRSLAQRVGIALGLTNLLVRRIVKKGWVRAVRVKPNRVTYFLTPAGFSEKLRMSRLFVQDSLRFYVSARERIRQSLSGVTDVRGPRRIVFYGTGEVAEIAYVCLRETDLELVGVVDDAPAERFLGLTTVPSDLLRDGMLDGLPFDRLVVTSFEDSEIIRSRLDQLGISPERVHWF